MTHQVRLAQIKQDLAQYNRLFQLAQRQKVKQLLTKQIISLNNQQLKIEKLIESQNKKTQQPQPIQTQVPKQVNIQQIPNKNLDILYTPLSKYSWEDQSKKIKIYFTLDNIGSECTADKIDIEFKPTSVELRLRGYKKQNLLFAIKKLYGQIVPEQCKYLVKTNLLSITLTKKSSGTWTQLNFKEDKFKTNEKEDVKDPSAGLMGMMKKMYQQGDENMKRTLAQAWTKANDKKGGKEDAFKFD